MTSIYRGFDFRKVAAVIEEHAPTWVSLKYIREHTGYDGSSYMARKRLEAYPNIEYTNFYHWGAAWRSVK